MPRTPHSLDRGDLLTDAVMSLLAESGATGVSLRRIAQARGVSVGALTNRWGTRSRMLHIAINYFRHRWTEVMAVRVWSEGVVGLLPESQDEIEDCRVWLSFCELAVSDAVLAECVAAQRSDERDLVQASTRAWADAATVTTVLALVEGLRVAICSPEPLSVAAAREVLVAYLDRQGAPTAA